MLSKTSRLKTDYEFNKTRKYGTEGKFNYFYIFVMKLKENANIPARVGVVMSTKFDKRSTVRNRVKRMFYRSVRQNFAKMGKDCWVVIHPRFSARDVTYENLNAELTEALQKIFIP